LRAAQRDSCVASRNRADAPDAASPAPRAAPRQLAWVRGDSPERPRKNASDDDDVRLRFCVWRLCARSCALR
jgi:hypothetical protein